MHVWTGAVWFPVRQGVPDGVPLKFRSIREGGASGSPFNESIDLQGFSQSCMLGMWVLFGSFCMFLKSQNLA